MYIPNTHIQIYADIHIYICPFITYTSMHMLIYTYRHIDIYSSGSSSRGKRSTWSGCCRRHAKIYIHTYILICRI
jgi:hypothetical protein